MTFQIGTLFLVGVGYLLLLFIIAYAAERGCLPRRLIEHPATYVLSLGAMPRHGPSTAASVSPRATATTSSPSTWG
jgi:hypothetical protein